MNVFAVKIVSDDRSGALRRLSSYLSLPDTVRRIAIKLNLCDYRRPETGAVSHPDVVRALLQVLRERYPQAEIFLCENDSSDTIVENMWGYLGLDQVATRYSARCVSLSQEEWIQVPIPGLHFQELEIPKIMTECDLLINHPKLKTHGKTKITCALKNLFGCYRQKNKAPLHQFLDEAIVDINLAIRPHVVIVDADLCVEGNRGPTQGLPKRLGLFIGGRDSVGVDSYCARLMGFKPNAVGHIRKAARAGCGSMRYIIDGDLIGEDLRPYRFQFSQGKFMFMQVARRLLSWSEAR